jgi:hypothetical protein
LSYILFLQGTAMPNTQRAKLVQAPQPETSLWLRTLAMRRPSSTHAAVAWLLSRAKDLCQEGVSPTYSEAQCLAALRPILLFVAHEKALHAEKTLSREMCGAALRIGEELLGLPPHAKTLRDPLEVSPPQTVRHSEAARTGALLLEAYRDAVRSVLKGPKQAGVRAAFGLGNDLALADSQQVADEIGRFLLAAQQHPLVIAQAKLLPGQLLGLAAQERVLRALDARRNEEAKDSASAYRRRVLHVALEYFLSRYQAALHLHLLTKPDALNRGLALVPARQRLVAETVAVGPLSLPFSCQVTDSGRLIFS